MPEIKKTIKVPPLVNPIVKKDIVGVPISPKEVKEDLSCLTLDTIFDVLRKPDFFEKNQTFKPLETPIVKMEEMLKTRNLVSVDGKSPKGCGGCRQRALTSVKLQVGRIFQSFFLAALDKPEVLPTLKTYLLENKIIPEDKKPVLYLRTGETEIKEIIF